MNPSHSLKYKGMIHVLLYLISLCCLPAKVFSQCTLPKPSGVTAGSITSCNAILSWKAVSGASYYQVKYKLSNEDNWTKMDDQLTTTNFNFIHLTPNTDYRLAVASYCANGQNSGWKSIPVKTNVATIPAVPVVVATGGNYITVSWSNECPCTSNNVRFKKSGQNQPWTVYKAVTIASYTFTGLKEYKDYKFSIQSEINGDTSDWTEGVAINSGGISAPSQSSGKPNIILYLLDDGRYDAFQPNGGPSWFETPSINRIANEGVNFQYAFPTTSQCGPSRVSIYTGLYAHKTGAIDNDSHHFEGLTMVQQVLRDAGYYTGFIGKYGQMQGQPEGFDWWLTSDGNVFNNPTYEINGNDTVINGHITDVYQWATNTFLNKVPPGKKFMLMFFTRAPHSPTTPRDEDKDLYTDEVMPLPANFFKYPYDYPSYFYEGGGHQWNKSIDETDSLKRLDFQCLHGVELNVTSLFEWLSTKGLVDSTMFIFSSDNGNSEGEHLLKGKQIGQEYSIRVPMFIRYPAWFPKGIVNSSVQALNIDIAPTMLDAAGIPDTMETDGISLRKLYNGTATRKYFYYQFAG